MITAEPTSYGAAVARLVEQVPVASRLNSAEWAAVPLALRDRAFFSAGVESIRTVATLQDGIRQALDGTGETTMDKSKFVASMRQALGAEPGDSGELTDLTSRRRLELIYDFQTEDAMEYGRWRAGQDPDLLEAYPAQELVRIAVREEPREWKPIWAAAGGRFPNGRMVARKDDAVWTAISRFGRPWPPFDFGSGMGLKDIDREEAEALGVVAPETVVAPAAQEFNAQLEASLPEATPSVMAGLREIFGDDVAVSAAGRVQWRGEQLGQLWQQAVAATSDAALSASGPHWLGRASAEAVAVGQRDLGIDLSGHTLEVRAVDLRHAYLRHGRDGDKPGDQVSLSVAEARAIALVWRSPQRATWGRQRQPASEQARELPAGWQSGQIQLATDLGNGWLVVGNYLLAAETRTLRARSLWKKRKGVTP